MPFASRAAQSHASWFLFATLAVACGSDHSDDFWSEPEGGSAGQAGSSGQKGDTAGAGSGNAGASGGASAGSAGTETGGSGAASAGSGNAGNGGTSGAAPVTGGSDASGGTSGATGGGVADGGTSASSGAAANGGTGAAAGSSGSDTAGGSAGIGASSNGGTAGDATPEGGSGADDAGGAPSSGGNDTAGSSASGTNNGGNGGAATAGTGGTGGALVAPIFDGKSGYVEIPDADIFSEPTTGELTVEAWMRPDSLSMPNQESSGYVHWLGKGTAGEHEWVARMYQRGNDEDRENRISFYAFNPNGGLGAGSYFQDNVEVGEWIHYVGSFDDVRTYIFKNGNQRDSDLLSGYDIEPRNGDAPVRIATRDRNSYFFGAIARVAFYDTRLSEARIAAHYAAAGPDYDAVILAEASLVAYYPLNETSGAKAIDAKGNHDGTYHGDVELGAARWPNR